MPFNKSVHQLILSLSDNEIQHLLSLINEDEENLFLTYKDTPVDKSSISLLSSHQSRLKKKIIHLIGTLRIRDSKKYSIEEEVFHYISTAEDLYGRNLFTISLQLLKKAKKIAIDYELFPLLLIINRHESLIFEIGKQSFGDMSLNQLNQEREKWINLIKNEKDYVTLFQNFRLKVIEYLNLRKPQEQKNLFTAFIENPLFIDQSNALSIKAQIKYFDINRVYYSTIGKHEKAMQYGINLIELFESNPNFIKTRPKGYCVTLLTVWVDAMYLNHESIDFYLKKVENYTPPSTRLKVYKFKIKSSHLLTYLRRKGIDKEKMFTAINETKKQVKQHFHALNDEDKMIMPLLLTECYLFYQEAEKALIELNLYFEHRKNNPQLRKDVYHEALLLQLLIHFELNNDHLLKTLASNVSRTFRNRKVLYDTERAILRFFKKKNNHDLSEIKSLYEELSTIAKDKVEMNFHIHNFHWIIWLERKIDRLEAEKMN